MSVYPAVRPLCALALSCWAIPASHAQSPWPGAPIEVFAEKAPLLRIDGSRTITVITADDIVRRGAISAAELVREVPGLHVDRAGNAGGASNVYIRGAEPNHTVVLVDGVRVNDPTDVRGGSYDLASISASEIERIEVLRGASSAQFGADAMGGVINIVTRRARPGETSGRVFAAAGASGYRQATAGAALGFAQGAAAASITRLEDGRDAEGGTVRRDAANASFAARMAGGELTLRARHTDAASRAFPESSGGIRLAQNRELERRDWRESLGALGWEHAFGATRLLLRASVTERDEDRISPAVAPGPGGFVPATVASTEFQRRGGEARLSRGFAVLDTVAVLGLEGWRESGSRRSVLDLGPGIPADFELTRDTRAAFAQLESQVLAKTQAVISLRHDEVDPGQSRLSRGVGARHDLGSGHALRAHWSEGFKPPSFFALADPVVGNPDLQPETSRSREFGWEYEASHARLAASAFATRYAGLVDFDPETFRMVNRTGASIRGVELQASWQLDRQWHAASSYTYVHSRLLQSDATLRNRPRHRATAALEHRWDAWSVRASIVHVGSTFDFSVPTGAIALSSFTYGDVSLGWRGRQWRAVLAADNVTDRRYESFAGFSAPGRRLRLALEFFL